MIFTFMILSLMFGLLSLWGLVHYDDDRFVAAIILSLLLAGAFATLLSNESVGQYNVTCRNTGETVYVDVISDLNELHGYEDCRIQLLETK